MLEQTDWLQTELDKLTSSPEGFPAKTYPLQESVPACQVSAAACGPSFTELSLKHDPVGQSLKMYLGLELSGLTQCLLIWQEQATPLGRWWWALSMSEPRTDDSGCGLLPTPRAQEPGSTSPGYGKGLASLAKQGMLPTPSATTYGRNKGGQNPDGKDRPSLETMAKGGMLPTPHANCHTGSGEKGEGGPNLQTAVNNGTGSGRLSPCFVEWMMGYPVGYTDVSD